ncbi:unnamed protein product [Pleuronectes platessa]|uniref:Uncharacterized protein n=1 Tax=Pleuronectes platessa TaxID=8262 RepID=A0A9N7VJL3_PLEPL|nr:unnamed protein product [Pleuronectes platessa]
MGVRIPGLSGSNGAIFRRLSHMKNAAGDCPGQMLSQQQDHVQEAALARAVQGDGNTSVQTEAEMQREVHRDTGRTETGGRRRERETICEEEKEDKGNKKRRENMEDREQLTVKTGCDIKGESTEVSSTRSDFEAKAGELMGPNTDEERAGEEIGPPVEPWLLHIEQGKCFRHLIRAPPGRGNTPLPVTSEDPSSD